MLPQHSAGTCVEGTRFLDALSNSHAHASSPFLLSVKTAKRKITVADPAQCITGNCLHEKLLPLSNGNCLRIRPLWLPILRGSEWFYSNTVDCPLVGTCQQRWWSLSHCGENTHASGQLPSRTEHRQGIVTTFFCHDTQRRQHQHFHCAGERAYRLARNAG